MALYWVTILSSLIWIFFLGKFYIGPRGLPACPQCCCIGAKQLGRTGQRSTVHMFSIYSGIYMSLGLGAHEWTLVCSFCLDVTLSLSLGHARYISTQNLIQRQNLAIFDWAGWADIFSNMIIIVCLKLSWFEVQNADITKVRK